MEIHFRQSLLRFGIELDPFLFPAVSMAVVSICFYRIRSITGEEAPEGLPQMCVVTRYFTLQHLQEGTVRIHLFRIDRRTSADKFHCGGGGCIAEARRRFVGGR